MRRRHRGFTLVELLVVLVFLGVFVGGLVSLVAPVSRAKQTEAFLSELESLMGVCQVHHLRDANGDGAPDGIWPTESDLRRYLPGWDGKNPWGYPVSLSASPLGVLTITQKLPAEVAEVVRRRFDSIASVSGGGGLVEVVLRVPPPPAFWDFVASVKRRGDVLYPIADVRLPGGEIRGLLESRSKQVEILRDPVYREDALPLGWYNFDVERRIGSFKEAFKQQIRRAIRDKFGLP